MIWQWLIIGVLVAAAAYYLVRMIRRSLGQPLCPTCAQGCGSRRSAKLWRKKQSGVKEPS